MTTTPSNSSIGLSKLDRRIAASPHRRGPYAGLDGRSPFPFLDQLLAAAQKRLSPLRHLYFRGGRTLVELRLPGEDSKFVDFIKRFSTTRVPSYTGDLLESYSHLDWARFAH